MRLRADRCAEAEGSKPADAEHKRYRSKRVAMREAAPAVRGDPGNAGCSLHPKPLEKKRFCWGGGQGALAAPTRVGVAGPCRRQGYGSGQGAEERPVGMAPGTVLGLSAASFTLPRLAPLTAVRSAARV